MFIVKQAVNRLESPKGKAWICLKHCLMNCYCGLCPIRSADQAARIFLAPSPVLPQETGLSLP